MLPVSAPWTENASPATEGHLTYNALGKIYFNFCFLIIIYGTELHKEGKIIILA